MTRRIRRTRGNDQGAAFVELPFVFIAFLLLALCFTALAQLFLDYHHLSGAARAAARYATKADYDPATPAPPKPSAAEVEAFAAQAASPLGVGSGDVQINPDTVAGNGVDVVVTHTEAGGAYGLVTGTVNRVLALFGTRLPSITLSAHATAINE
jgi:Flp pilus assembly protein TadG